MTEEKLVQAVHRLYEKNTDYPDSGSEDYQLIRDLLNDGIEAWGGRAQEASTSWRELFKRSTEATSGELVTVTNQGSYDTPSDFDTLSSFVSVADANGGEILYTYKAPDKVLQSQKNNPHERFFWLTPGKIHLNPVPSTDGAVIKYDYYKRPTLLNGSTNVIEMKKPYFAIYHAIAHLIDEERPDLAGTYLVRAGGVLDEMLIDNEAPPHLNSYAIEDLDYEMYGGGFGR